MPFRALAMIALLQASSPDHVPTVLSCFSSTKKRSGTSAWHGRLLHHDGICSIGRALSTPHFARISHEILTPRSET